MSEQPVDYERDEELPPLEGLPLKDLKEYRKDVVCTMQLTRDMTWKKIWESHLSEIDDMIEAHYQRITRILDGEK